MHFTRRTDRRIARRRPPSHRTPRDGTAPRPSAHLPRRPRLALRVGQRHRPLVRVELPDPLQRRRRRRCPRRRRSRAHHEIESSASRARNRTRSRRCDAHAARRRPASRSQRRSSGDASAVAANDEPSPTSAPSSSTVADSALAVIWSCGAQSRRWIGEVVGGGFKFMLHFLNLSKESFWNSEQKTTDRRR